MRISVTVSAAPPLALPPELKKYKARRLLDEAGQRALSAVWQAAGAAGLDLTVHSPTRAVIVSAAAYDPRAAELRAADRDLGYAGLRANVNPLWLLKVLPNMPAAHLAILTKSGGPSHTVADRDQATRLARALIVSGEADTVLHVDLPAADAAVYAKRTG